VLKFLPKFTDFPLRVYGYGGPIFQSLEADEQGADAVTYVLYI